MKAALSALLFAMCTINAWAQSVPTSTDPRVSAWIDPHMTFASYPRYKYQFQVGSSQPAITAIAEPGWWDPKISQYTVQKTTDPLNGSKKAFRHKITKGMTYLNGTSARAMILSQWGLSASLYDGVPYWAAFAIYVDKDHLFNGTGGDLHIFNLGHAVTSSNSIAMNTLFLRRNGTLELRISSNKVLNGTNATSVGTTGFKKTIEKGIWHYLVFQFKYSWDVTKGPYTRVWWAKGSGGALVPVTNTNIANAFRESAGYHPWYFGIYAWDLTTGGNGIWSTSPASTSRTLFTKGLYVLRDQAPTLTKESMLALVRSK